ncbi:glutamate-rich protein 6B [Anomaloglossus baeobatrachus]|uniref:glutamate-rich protein 6B n=1 Tax=Anomaloglossus baeobatrachus TaxID=238106 RepID=UPI003F501A80
MSGVSKSNQMANRSNGSMKDQVPRPSKLTVENVSKLELEFDTFDGDRRKVEEYIRRNQHLEELRKSTGPSQPETQGIDLVERGTNTTLEDLGGHGDKRETQNEFGTQQCRKENSKSENRQITNIRKIPCKNVQTQTEYNEAEAAISKNGSITRENTVEQGVSNFEHVNTKTPRQLPLTCEDDPLTTMEDTISICEFCNLPMKTFPSIEQLSSEPGGMLFCCVKIQELFQYMIMETIESYTPEKTEEEFEDEQTPTPISDEKKALCELRKQIKKEYTEENITNLANHLSTHGSLFLMEKISFTLASANDTTTNYALSDNEFSDQAHNIDDDCFIPVLDNEFIKRPSETIKKRYSSGQNFCTLFPDGTGQVLYPSGNIAILIACSKPTQFIFIILEDAEKKPKIQAIFMSNGHAACYHLNGMLWTILNPWGGSYFDENGAQKKHWTWWDFSQHVHAPRFQPITCTLNSNIEVKVVKQDQVHLSFTKDKEKVTFNVGSKLLLKNTASTSSMMPSTSETEIHCSKKIEIFRLLNKIRSLVRSSVISKDGEEIIQGYIYQLQKVFKLIIALINKQVNTARLLSTTEIQESVTAVKKPCPHSDKSFPSKTEKKNTLPNKKKLPH